MGADQISVRCADGARRKGMTRVVRMLGGSAALALLLAVSPARADFAIESDTLDISGFVESAISLRDRRGLSKFRNTMQIEVNKEWGDLWIFDNVSTTVILRASYDAVHDINDDEYGDEAGGSINIQSLGVPSGSVPWGGGLSVPALLPVGGAFDLRANPNEGLVVLADHISDPEGGVSFGVPVRPCDKDSRGCLKGYMDDSLNDLRFPEFAHRADFLREAYVDAAVPLGLTRSLNFRIGRQQVVWGRTDLFRVLDILNPVDFSRNNIYDELEDIRYPMWMLVGELRLGAVSMFEDLNFQVVWNVDRFRPSRLGQAGTPNIILDAGSFFRGFANCWDNGCTVSNFAPPLPLFNLPPGLYAYNFPPGVIGIRSVDLPAWKLSESQVGVRVEGIFKRVGFSLNFLRSRSHLPSLRGGIPADNPFSLPVDPAPRSHLVAFDIAFPRIHLVGGSLDFYVDPIKSVFRVELAHTWGEEFANTRDSRLFSRSKVIRYVVGWDRNTFIPLLNRRRSFLFSAQVFGEHLLDHVFRREILGPTGMPNWEENWIATLLIRGFYKSDRVSPQLIIAHDVRANATVFAPSIDWLISDSWRLIVGANLKRGRTRNRFDDCRTCNPFMLPIRSDPSDTTSQGLGGLEPLGRFRAGPIGMAEREDEIQITLRYRF